VSAVIAKSFEQARGAFEIAWRHFLVKRTEADFAEYRRDRAFHAWKQAMWAAGLKLPTQAADGRAELLWCCDRPQRHGRPCLRRAHGARDSMKFVEPRPFADPDVVARKLVEIASLNGADVGFRG